MTLHDLIKHGSHHYVCGQTGRSQPQSLSPGQDMNHHQKQGVSVILWPLSWILILESVDLLAATDSIYQARVEEIAEVAFHLTLFSPTEINQLTGGTIQILISPALIPPSYSVFREYRYLLGERIRDAYRDQKANL